MYKNNSGLIVKTKVSKYKKGMCLTEKLVRKNPLLFIYPTVEKRKRRTPISTKLRFEIFTRDKHTCQYCGKTIYDGIKLVVDHKIPIAEGGTDNYDNLITACKECNGGKSNKVL